MPFEGMELTACEQALADAAAMGALVDARAGAAALDDPATGADWGPERTVRGEVLFQLVVGEPAPRGVALRGARIIGGLNLEAARLRCPMLLEGCFFDAPINLRQARAEAIRIAGCRLTCLDAAQLETRGDVTLDRSTATVVNLLQARVGGELSLNGMVLSGGRWPLELGDTTLSPFADVSTNYVLENMALFADLVIVERDMICRRGFAALGEVRLFGAHIRGQLEFIEASLVNDAGLALTAQGIRVDGSMFCHGTFVGGVDLLGAQIGRQLLFEESVLAADGRRALNLEEARVDSSLWLLFGTRPAGAVSLANARIGTLYDREQTWPRELILRGCTYDQLQAVPEVAVKTRLRWLRLDAGGYAPQPYEQLSAFYRSVGRDDDARSVAIAKQRHRRSTLRWPARAWSLLLGGIVGHGYRAWLAGIWLVVLWGAGTILFGRAYPDDFRAATNPGNTPEFEPWLYSLDVILPVVNLRQGDAWIAEGSAHLGALLTVAGWVLASAVIAALTGLLKRD
jgi:hypothetical protein